MSLAINSFLEFFFRFLDLIQELELYPCLMSENEVVSLPPVTNSDTTKVFCNHVVIHIHGTTTD